jgi:energy-coupling factor transporter ATP-binding protein EcfA2
MEKVLKWITVTGLSISGGILLYERNWELAITALILPLLIALIPIVFQNKAQKEDPDRSKIRGWLKGRDFQKQYFTHLQYQHRDFDIKGLSTQTIHTLELEQVFVELKLQPQVAHDTSSDPLSRKPNKLRSDSFPIWHYFSLLANDEKAQNAKIAIVGPPGSGKTTLLKHMALLLTHSNKHADLKKLKFNKIPALLFLRDHVKDIITDPSILLPQLVEATIIKWDIPVPASWFHKRLKDGSCLVMLDGLDEVADLQARHRIVSWMEKQIKAYPKNTFIITSRPHGYQENPLAGVSVLEVMPFNRVQIDLFILNWYLANEIKSHTKDDPGVRMTAKSGADDLLRRLEKSPTLMELAVNPLLLTMIATVHRYRSALPGRRVELYKEICEVFLGRRQEAKGLDLDLIPAQKQSVLQALAYEMMYANAREIRAGDAAEIIRTPLTLVNSNSKPEDFLKSIEQQSGLLIEREMGVYSFAHKTFQEYLTSMHMLDTKLEDELKSRINDDWWHEVIKLYSAQTDATAIITTCLDQEPPSALALSLAIQCLEEARQVQPYIKDAVEKILEQSAEDTDPEIRSIVGQAILANRVKHLTALSPTISIDTKLVTNAEYQVFIDEMLLRGVGEFYPLQWTGKSFPAGSAHIPVTGLIPTDALAFCEWLTELHAGSGEWYFRLPLKNEIKDKDYAQIPGFWMLVNADTRNSDSFKNLEIWVNSSLSRPNNIETYIRKASQDDIKAIISLLRSNDRKLADLEHDLYLQVGRVLKKILRASVNAHELLSETAGELYKSINQIPLDRAIDFAYGSPDPETYDQSISDNIDRIANEDFEAGIMTSIKCYSNIVNSDPRAISNYKPLYTAFAFTFLIKWMENTKVFFSRSSMNGIQRKIDFLLDWYMDGLTVSARQQNIVPSFEGLLIVKEIKDRHFE